MTAQMSTYYKRLYSTEIISNTYVTNPNAHTQGGRETNTQAGRQIVLGLD